MVGRRVEIDGVAFGVGQRLILEREARGHERRGAALEVAAFVDRVARPDVRIGALREDLGHDRLVVDAAVDEAQLKLVRLFVPEHDIVLRAFLLQRSKIELHFDAWVAADPQAIPSTRTPRRHLVEQDAVGDERQLPRYARGARDA